VITAKLLEEATLASRKVNSRTFLYLYLEVIFNLNQIFLYVLHLSVNFLGQTEQKDKKPIKGGTQSR
jgi:hypothetical protein